MWVSYIASNKYKKADKFSFIGFCLLQVCSQVLKYPGYSRYFAKYLNLDADTLAAHLPSDI